MTSDRDSIASFLATHARLCEGRPLWVALFYDPDIRNIAATFSGEASRLALETFPIDPLPPLIEITYRGDDGVPIIARWIAERYADRVPADQVISDAKGRYTYRVRSLVLGVVLWNEIRRLTGDATWYDEEFSAEVDPSGFGLDVFVPTPNPSVNGA